MRKDRWQRWKTTIWAARPVGSYPNLYVEVGPGNTIEIFVCERKGQTAEGFRVDRKLARLAATRINQCLDDTK